MATTNHRLLLKSLGEFELDEQPIPKPTDSGIIVKVTHAGICHSDVHMAYTPKFHATFDFPRVLGHEISGEIHELSEKAKEERPDLAVGDKVLVFPWGNCNDCNFCRSDCSFCCSSYGKGPNGNYVYGIWRDGGYQQYVVIDVPQFLIKVPAEVSMAQAAIATCSGLTAYNATHKLRESVETAKKANGGAYVAVVGAGGLALWAIQCIKVLYSPGVTVVAVDISDQKLQDAKDQGADVLHKWGTTESAKEASDELVKSVGARMDGVIDFIGAAPVVERSFLSLNLGGTLCLVGLGGNMMPEMTLNSVLRRNVTVRGSMVGTLRQTKEVVQLLADKKISSPPIYNVTLNDVEDVMKKMKSGDQRGRAVVVMD